MQAKGVYAGTFDPITLGHEDLVRRMAGLFEEVVVAVAENRAKQPMFDFEARIQMARDSLRGYPNVEVRGFSGLLVDFMRVEKAQVIIRGLRAVSDFDFEFQMAGMNRRLLPGVETIFMTPCDPYSFISSTMVREIAQLKGDVAPFVNPLVRRRLLEKMANEEQSGN